MNHPGFAVHERTDGEGWLIYESVAAQLVQEPVPHPLLGDDVMGIGRVVAQLLA